MSPPALRLTGLTKRFPGRPGPAVNIDALDIRAGECLAVVGPSGAGKSTLLRLLHFLSDPTSGTIELFGKPVGYPAPLVDRRQIAMVFQRPELMGGSIRRNVGYGLRLRGLSDDTLVERLIESVGLGPLIDEPARQLSGGEAQRVALARVLAIDPRIILLDEPTANLDPGHVAQIEARLQALRDEAERTLVLVTHNLHQARRLADRVVLMLDGKIVEVTETQAFFESPQDPRTADFVRGDMVY